MSPAPQDVPPDPELAAEQEYVSGLYQRLDDVRDLAVRRLKEALATVPINPQSLGEREAQANFQTARLTALDAAESGLCFGRLDLRERERPRYIGRIGLSREAAPTTTSRCSSTGGHRPRSPSTPRPR